MWHLGLTDGASDETKARYAFVFGDFHRVHRTALIACVYRAAEWRHKAIELAAHRLLQHLDKTTGLEGLSPAARRAAPILAPRAHATSCALLPSGIRPAVG